ncbi:MAG: hypothetical protein JETCAE03_15830 [Ignavibacteriaceae bacterium]|nr:MAG: hypothetical protein BroJett017_08910 [Ignavibacteriota bacterium]GJQ42085.1 MAG: hypothetical protein JETCAE03_15830 [Ignavibacteriaceae bacterium]
MIIWNEYAFNPDVGLLAYKNLERWKNEKNDFNDDIIKYFVFTATG